MTSIVRYTAAQVLQLEDDLRAARERNRELTELSARQQRMIAEQGAIISRIRETLGRAG